jgi:hypothetical protein
MEPINQIRRRRVLLMSVGTLAFVFCSMTSMAQQRVVANLPDAPAPKEQPDEPTRKPDKSAVKTTYDIVSRRSFFFPDLAHTNKPLSSGQKFLLATDKTVAPSALIFSAMSAGVTQARNSWPGYGQGWNGYGKRYGATLAIDASTEMFGTFLLSSMLRHDPRYYVLADGTFSQKIGHALKSVLVTRTDSGGQAMNISGLLGPLGAEGLANTYLPDAERTGGQTFERYGIQLAVIAGGNVAKEFWPVIFKRLRGKRASSSAAYAPPGDKH